MKTPKNIVMMEDHDKAYLAWKERGVRGRTLVHVDAHIDFGWVPEVDFDEIGAEQGLLLNPYLKSRKKMVHIGNYICPAMRDGMVNKFYWVVPDESWSNARGRRQIVKQLKQVLRIKRYAGPKLEQYPDHLRCRLFDKDVIVCSLGHLERIDEPVLLDIDVDFMLTRFIWDDLNPRRVPWIYPEELFNRLGPKINDIEVLSIAYSVEGGFTPLKFKYLGDELRSLFEGGLSAYNDKKDASFYFNLSLQYLDRGPDGASEAARFYREAVQRDRTYATRYNNYGILYSLYNKLKLAEIEYKKFLRLDENNIHVLNGLGHIALAKKRFNEAGGYFDRCLALDTNYFEARSGKGIVCFKKRWLREAEEIFSALKTDRPDDAESCWWLGHLAQRRGDASSAVSYYKDAVLRGGDGPLVHLILARLYLIMGNIFRAVEELKRFFHALRSGI